MEHAEKTLIAEVQKRLEELQTNPFAAEKAAGLPPDAIRNVLRGEKKSGTALNRAKEVCDALGLEFYIGPRRDFKGPDSPPIADPTEFARIPLHEASLAAGEGHINDGEAKIGALAFRREWLTGLNVSPASAVLARAKGDSMAPSIHDGDLLLIDRSRHDIPVRQRDPSDRRRAPIYALRDDGLARVKRVERPERDLIMLLSDNPAWPAELIRGPDIAKLDIIGKVMWWGHTNKER